MKQLIIKNGISYDEAVAIGNRKFTRITKDLILKAIELKNKLRSLTNE